MMSCSSFRIIHHKWQLQILWFQQPVTPLFLRIMVTWQNLWKAIAGVHALSCQLQFDFIQKAKNILKNKILISPPAGILVLRNPSYWIGKSSQNCLTCIKMEPFHGMNFQMLFDRFMKKEWDSQLIGESMQTSRRKRIISMPTLMSVCVREQSVMTCQVLLTLVKYDE